MIILGPNQERNCCFIEASSLPVPFLDRIECAFSREIEHKEDGNGIVADEGEHIDKFALPTQIPNRECDLGVPNRYGLLHEINTCFVSSNVLARD